MNIYAQLNDSNICVGVSRLSKAVIDNKLISLESYNLSLIGKEFDGTEFLDVPTPPEVLRERYVQKVKFLRERFISEAEIEHEGKFFKGDRETGLEVNSYINTFDRAVESSLRQPTNIVARWRTQDNSYIDLFRDDMVVINFLQSQIIAKAFNKQEIVDNIITNTPDADLENLNIKELFDSANAVINQV